MSGDPGGSEVVLDHVRKAFESGRIRAVEDVSLRLAAGEFVALVGRSGCGKSTLLNLIGGLDVPDDGTITIDGVPLEQLDPSEYRAQTVGFVFQSHHLIPTLSAMGNVQVPMMGGGLSRRERAERAGALLAEVGLSARADAMPATLSGGERQRVALARALANRPRLLLADEPTGALDSTTGAEITGLLRRLRELRGMTILLVTNDDQLARIADRVVRMRDGRLEAVDPVIRDEAPRSA